MPEVSEVTAIILWVVDMLKGFYLLEGVSLFLLIQIMIWVGVSAVLLRYGLDKFGG